MGSLGVYRAFSCALGAAARHKILWGSIVHVLSLSSPFSGGRNYSTVRTKPGFSDLGLPASRYCCTVAPEPVRGPARSCVAGLINRRYADYMRSVCSMQLTWGSFFSLSSYAGSDVV